MPTVADIYFHTYGKADEPAVVLLHGAGGDYLYWPPVIRRMKGLQVFALDLPGHGKSAGLGYQTLSAYAQEIMQWQQELGLARAAYVGHSMGGGIAMLLALQHPERIQALGLISTAARLPVNPTLLSDTQSETTLPRAIEQIIAWSFGPQAAAGLLELATSRMASTRPSVLYNDFLACDRFDVFDRLGQINQPACVICGTEDRMTPVRNSQQLVDALPAAELVTIPGAGHMVMLEQPEQVATGLEKFLLNKMD